MHQYKTIGHTERQKWHSARINVNIMVMLKMRAIYKYCIIAPEQVLGSNAQ